MSLTFVTLNSGVVHRCDRLKEGQCYAKNPVFITLQYRDLFQINHVQPCLQIQDVQFLKPDSVCGEDPCVLSRIYLLLCIFACC